jgi:hypothetical protein
MGINTRTIEEIKKETVEREGIFLLDDLKRFYEKKIHLTMDLKQINKDIKKCEMLIEQKPEEYMEILNDAE